MFPHSVKKGGLLHELRTSYSNDIVAHCQFRSMLFDEYFLDPLLFQVDPYDEGCGLDTRIIKLLRIVNPAKNTQPDLMEHVPETTQSDFPKVSPLEVDNRNKDEKMGEVENEGLEILSTPLPSLKITNQAENAAEMKRLTRAERNRIYARQSRLRLKHRAEDLERKVQAKREKECELRTKLNMYHAKLQTAASDLNSRPFNEDEVAVLRALSVCEEALKRCSRKFEAK